MNAIKLVVFAERHVDQVARMIADPEILRFARVPEPTPDDFAPQWFARYEAGRTDGTRAAFAIEARDTDEFLGIALAPELDQTSRTAELGYLLAPEARGRGVATAALRQLTAWAWEQGMFRLQLYISTDNVASQAVARRCGFTLEGVLRSMHFKQDLREDTQLWSLLPGEPTG